MEHKCNKADIKSIEKCELNAEQIKKALDWLDSLVGNSNDSGIALLTYQLLGILYDTCEELTEENERLMREKTALECVVATARNQAKSDTVREMQERLKSLLKTDYINGTREHALSVIDQIAKEMLEETK